MPDRTASGNAPGRLQERVEALAMLLALAGEDPATPEALFKELDQICRQAETNGLAGLSQEALDLAIKAKASDNPAATISKGLIRLQKSLVTAGRSTPTSSPQSLGDDPELIADFVMEAREHLDSVEAKLLVLDNNPAQMEAIHSLFRAFHTIKGLAGFLELHAVREVAHEVETLLDLARQSRLAITREITDLILAGADYLGRWVKHLDGGAVSTADPALVENGDLLCRIRGCLAIGGTLEEHAQNGAAIRDRAPRVSDQFGGADGALCALGHESSQSQESRQSGPPGAAAILTNTAMTPATKARSVKVDTRKLDYLVDMVGELVIAQSLIRFDSDLAAGVKPQMAHNLNQLARITDEVQRTAMTMRMVEVGPLFQKMSRLVRDLARKFGKTTVLETEGEHVEVDRQIVEDLADPLMHMVRNSVDHGVETTPERIEAGKDTTSRITLRAMHQAGNIIVQISDDGRGLNREKILSKAKKSGLLSAADDPSDAEVYRLILHPGFSTADELSEVSGRGVGMDVVRRQILRLRGSIDIQTAAGKGTTFSLKLPLTLAIIDGLLVTVGSERFVVPIFSVRELLRHEAGRVSRVESNAEVILVRDQLLPLVRLQERFSIPPASCNAEDGVIVVAEENGKRFALLVDQVIGKQEVVIKNLGPTFRNVAGFAGAAILGDGHVGLILDMMGVFGGKDD